MIKNPTFGSDAELFLKTLSGDLFPSCGLVGGTKEKPRSLGEGFYIQEDNVSVEFNIPVCKEKDQFVKAVERGVMKVSKELPPSLRIDMQMSSHSFPSAYIDWIPQAKVFGCEPDYNAWTLEQNPKPSAPDPYLRTAAAHIHIGWDNPTSDDQIKLIKMADIFVSLPYIETSPDRTRRQLYGKAGCFRPKDYGVEHRVLDNFWIFSKSNIASVWSGYQKAIEAVNLDLKIDDEDIPEIIRAINEYEEHTCLTLYRKYWSRLKSMREGM